MEIQDIISITIGVLGIGGFIFGIFHYFKNPQIKSEKKDALFEQQIKFINEINEKRFQSLQDSFQSLLLQSNNHINTVDTNVQNLTKTIIEMGKDICTLSTIINERIPKK
jgi:hypothetical protein